VTATARPEASATVPTREGRRRGANLVAAGIAAVGCGLLAARPALVDATTRPVMVLALLFVGLLLVGAFLPLAGTVPHPRPRLGSTAAVAVGVAAFLAGRVLIGGHPPTRATIGLVAANTLAAVAEEAWFRRLCFGLLTPAGPAYAVLGSALLFALVHVSTYGLWVLPLDLAAGLVLGWQRAATGSWRASAITHVIANLLVVL
jgi:membrane protease YdiL (CAAX protease family)